MTNAVQRILEAFDCLSEKERHEVISVILRHARDLEWPPLDDETIDRLADEAFLEYDAREAASPAHPRAWRRCVGQLESVSGL